MSGPAWMYGDPAKVLERAQEIEAKRKARSCDGCKSKAYLWGVAWCERGMTQAGENNMRRCAKYEATKGAQ